MPIVVEELEGGVTRVLLSGRIDIGGAHQIDMPMSLIAGSKRNVLIDLSGVDFMASMGLRSLVITGKSILSKGGKVALFGPQPPVEEVITTTGIHDLIAIYHDEAEALAAVKPA